MSLPFQGWETEAGSPGDLPKAAQQQPDCKAQMCRRSVAPPVGLAMLALAPA